MTARNSLGEFEQLVLLAIMRRSGDAYGVSIHEEIEESAGRRTRRGAVYVALERLERKGLVDSGLSSPSSERGGRAKRLYEVTEEGRVALQESRDVLLRLWDGLESELERVR